MTKLSFFSLLVVGLFVLPACSAQRINLVAAGEVRVAIAETEPAQVREVAVLESADDVAVFGRVTRHFNRAYTLRGHVEIHVRAPDGRLIADRRVAMRTRRTTRHAWEGRFRTRFDDPLPQNATVEVAWHRGDHGDG